MHTNTLEVRTSKEGNGTSNAFMIEKTFQLFSFN